jgi:hypothetical protein
MPAESNQLAMRSTTRTSDRPVVYFVSGRQAVLQLRQSLIEFSGRCFQPGAMHDLAYFLSKPGALPRVPHLLLISKTADLNLRQPNPDDLLGLVLIFEQHVSGFGAGAFATNDRSGRSSLVALPWDRSWVAALATRALLDRGAHLVLMSFRTEEGSPAAATEPLLLSVGGKSRPVARWALRDRTIPGYLPLAETFDATMAMVGQRTRRNLRYYRRRAEADLGCVFLPDIEVTREEVLGFNRQCMFAVPSEVAGWRYDSLRELSRPVFMGLKDRDGRWLSMLGGRRYLDRSEILWQMNRDGLPAYSLGTAMRAYFIEHEIAHGSRRLYTEGGTPHSMKFSFTPEKLTDLVVVRRTLQAKLMQMVARRYIKPDNELSHMLEARGLEWRPC